MNNIHYVTIGVILASSMLVTPLMQMSFAHQRALFEINGKDYLFVVGSLNEPAQVDDKTGVDFRAIWPNATDPTDSRTNGTSPITGLENSLKVEILAGDKNMTSDLEPAFGELGSYESEPFYPTVATTYDYRLFGNINGTNFDVTFSCLPTGEVGQSDNSTVQISDNVVRKALLGGFGCPEDRVGFPEPYVSNFEMSKEINQTAN